MTEGVEQTAYGAITAREYWARKGAVDLFVYRKFLIAPAAEPRPVFFLVHGSSESGPTGFDLRVPGRSDYSMMDRFAAWGFDVWTMDHEGYGRSSRTGSRSDIRMAVDDLLAATDVVFRETGQTSVAFYGQSAGALRAALFAEHCPERVSRLILDAFVWTGEGSPTLARRRERLDDWRTRNTRSVDRAFYRSMFERDMPGTSEAGVADAFADSEARYGGEVPSGTYLDMCVNLPLNDPSRIHCPVLIVRGEHDGIATDRDISAYFMALPIMDKQLAVLPGLAHVSPLGINRHLFWHVVHQFLTTPPRAD